MDQIPILLIIIKEGKTLSAQVKISVIICVQAQINVQGGKSCGKNKRAGPNKLVLWGKLALKNKRALHVY